MSNNQKISAVWWIETADHILLVVHFGTGCNPEKLSFKKKEEAEKWIQDNAAEVKVSKY